jgi:hypothetical protein
MLECNRNLALRPEHLFGDYEYLIDKYLQGDKHIKKAVADADWQERGFESLRHFLSIGKNKNYKHDSVYIICSQEGPNPTVTYLSELEDDLHENTFDLGLPTGISMHKGSFRVDVARGGTRHRQTFKTKEEALNFRSSLS